MEKDSHALAGEAEVKVFDNFLPSMLRKLGEQAFMQELYNGFRLLADTQAQIITFKSLKKNVQLLGLGGMADDELQAMIAEGDLDDDGALNESEFCVLMLRLSPSLMMEAREWLEDALAEELACSMVDVC